MIYLRTIITTIFAMFVVAVSAINYTFDTTKGIRFAWVESDAACAYAVSGARIIERIKSVESTANYGEFNNPAWALEGNSTYKVYYPYNSSYTTNGNKITALPITYKEQKQTKNNSLDHLSAYDYMVAHCTTTETTADFDFEHFGAVICIEWKAKEKMTVSAVSLSTTDNLFTTEAEMNLNTKTLNTVSTANSITLALDDIEIEEGATLKAFMMVAPANLNAMEMTLTITTKDGTKLQRQIEGATILPGKCYPISVDGSMPGVEITTNSKALPQETSITSTLQSPRGYAPDFLIDTENQFTPVPATAIVNVQGEASQRKPCFTIEGKRIKASVPNKINISNGKKYLNR